MHMLVELGPFLCVVLLAAPLAQLQSLIRWDYLSQASDLEGEARTGLKQTRSGQSNCPRQCGTRRSRSPLGLARIGYRSAIVITTQIPVDVVVGVDDRIRKR